MRGSDRAGALSAYRESLGIRRSLAERGRLAGTVALGSVGMLMVAGFLEGIGRQVITDDWTRYAIGIGLLVLWAIYFRSGPSGGRGADNHG